MTENKSSLSRITGHFKLVARDTREGANLLTTSFVGHKVWSAYGHLQMVIAVLKSVDYAAKALAQNPAASSALAFTLIALGAAATSYGAGGCLERKDREYVEELTREYYKKNKDTPSSTP